MISLHVVSGPWTSIVAALDKGRFNIAVCRRYNPDYSSRIRILSFTHPESIPDPGVKKALVELDLVSCQNSTVPVHDKYYIIFLLL
jgi:hypothetical protein